MAIPASTAVHSGKAVTATGRPPVVGRLWDAAELIWWLAVLNALVLAFTLLGGVVLGLAPAAVAAVRASRARLRGQAQPLVRTFAATWRRELWHANALLAPVVVVALLLTLQLGLRPTAADGWTAALWAALALVVVIGVVALTMDAHYEVPRQRCLRTALRFVLANVPGALLLVAVTALAGAAVVRVPGLLPVVAVGAWLHAVTGICLSLYARNDALLDTRPASAAGSGPRGHDAPTRGRS